MSPPLIKKIEQCVKDKCFDEIIKLILLKKQHTSLTKPRKQKTLLKGQLMWQALATQYNYIDHI